VNLADRYFVVRAASLYVAVILTMAAWLLRRPNSRAVAGALLAFTWNLPLLLVLHVAAQDAGWWRFDAQGGLLLGMPVDLYLAWACLWGAFPALALSSWPIAAVIALALGIDLAVMPAAAPVVQLGSGWLVGEFFGLAFGLLPAQLLARWTARDEHLKGRAFLQVIAFAGLMLCVLPAIVIEGSGGAWSNPFARPVWQVSLMVQALAIPALLGLTAVQEFVTRGHGTPVPFDPPRRIVTTGVYAYIGNPMQLSAVTLLLMLGLVLWNPWVAAAGVMAHIYSAGLAGWDEDEDLRRRFGKDWATYRSHVRRWMPRCRPWYSADRPVATLFVSDECGMCREVGEWFRRRGVRGLAIVPAESHPSRALMRITYEPADGSRAASGVEAVARALEHVHLAWATIGFVLRMPVVASAAQLLADVSGAEPRPTGTATSRIPAKRTR
jgi:protein-S-isoprenylcysteine O-methyltransferase Ste14